MRISASLFILAACSSAPDHPTFVAHGSSDRTATLLWQAHDGATSYTIERGTSEATLAPLVTVAPDAYGYLDTGLDAETTYFYRFTANLPSEAVVEPVQQATTTNDPPLITGKPTPIGDPIVAVMSASGGIIEVPSVGARVEVPEGAVASGTTITVTPVAGPRTGDVIEDDPGVMIETSSPFVRAPMLAFTVGDDDPEGLRIATQNREGMWISQPRAVEGGMVRSELPIELAAAARTTRAAPLAYHAGIKLRHAHMVPNLKTLKVNDSVGLMPFGLFSDDPCITPRTNAACRFITITSLALGTTSASDVLRPARQFVKPLANSVPNQERTWIVVETLRNGDRNVAIGGNARVGRVTKTGSTGATYTAPAAKPAGTITVKLAIVQTSPERLELPSPVARIRIEDPGSIRVTGKYSQPASRTACSAASVDLADEVSFAVTLDDQLEFHAEAISNMPTSTTNIVFDAGVMGMVTKMPEILTMTGARIDDLTPEVGRLYIHVAVEGTSIAGACTITTPAGPIELLGTPYLTPIPLQITEDGRGGLQVVHTSVFGWTFTAEYSE